ncbi:hypothetical protein ACET3Z_012180 [Daucus carota]
MSNQMESNSSGRKEAWPELVGEKGDVAAAKIEKENRKVHAVVVLEGSPVTLDLNPYRVRVFVNIYGLVVDPPRIG